MNDDDLPAWARRARTGWTHVGGRRPPFATEPGPGQESVWDYPRPPVVVTDDRQVIIGDPQRPLISTTRSLRVLETASPPTIYVPAADVAFDLLVVTAGTSRCEWKGVARYWALASDPGPPIGWDYPEPFGDFAILADHLACYPGRIACRIDGELVRAQAGGFYGGWVTDEIVGPYKGEPGTGHW